MRGINFQNLLLRSLIESDLSLLQPHLEPITLTPKSVIEMAGRTIRFVCFFEHGIASTIAELGPARKIEVAITGREGLSGIPTLLGSERAPYETRMHTGGLCHRVEVGILRQLLTQSETLWSRMLNAVQLQLTQVASTAASNGLANLEARLARWFLMAHDRSDDVTVLVTHDIFASVLGVRRPGLTENMNKLEAFGCLISTRGRVKITSRVELMRLSKGT